MNIRHFEEWLRNCSNFEKDDADLIMEAITEFIAEQVEEQKPFLVD